MHTTIKSLGSLDAGELIPSLQVRIKKLGCPTDSQPAQWKRQSAIGQDNTGEIRDLLESAATCALEGNDITITSGERARHQDH
jgi:hypothetical protein